MTFLVVTAAGVLLVAGFHLVAGWLLASRLHDEALRVDVKPRDLGVRARAVDNETIILESPTPRQDIGHPGHMGLRWPDGYGRVGEVVSVSDGQVTREYSHVEGQPPPVCVGPIEDCPPLELDGFFYPRDPNDADLEYREVVYDSPLGPMGAWLVPADPGRRWAIHCHGWTVERRELVRMLPSFHSHDVTSLVIDYRNDPGQPLDPTGRYRFGLSEWEDLEAAVEHALGQGAEEVVLTGCSTGAALVMAFLERSRLADRVVALVFDSPNVSLIEAVRHATRDQRATRLMVEFGLWMADLRWKIDWDATNYVQRAREIINVPTLVFHGTSDQRVPISVSRRLEVAVPGLIDLVETPAAGHVMSWNADPQRYQTYLERFLERI
ncbi:MAG: alpha/beta fold hydrolase [Acidimicrobiia bacterium]